MDLWDISVRRGLTERRAGPGRPSPQLEQRRSLLRARASLGCRADHSAPIRTNRARFRRVDQRGADHRQPKRMYRSIRTTEATDRRTRVAARSGQASDVQRQASAERSAQYSLGVHRQRAEFGQVVVGRARQVRLQVRGQLADAGRRRAMTRSAHGCAAAAASATASTAAPCRRATVRSAGGGSVTSRPLASASLTSTVSPAGTPRPAPIPAEGSSRFQVACTPENSGPPSTVTSMARRMVSACRGPEVEKPTATPGSRSPARRAEQRPGRRTPANPG